MKGLGIGITVNDEGRDDLAGLLARFREAEELGFQSAWTANVFAMDAMTLLALAGLETRRIELGTAVVPTYSRHPFYMAQQALSTQSAAGGRFVCGLGPSHKVVIEDVLGLSYAKPARHVREYVQVVKQLVDTGRCEFQGETYHVNASLAVPGADSLPVLIGALGPVMRRIAGSLCEGTITWMVGPRTLGEHVAPGVRAAAEEAGRPAPRVVAGLPVVLTDDPAGAREKASKQLAMYGTLPSYRAMLELEGLASPGDLVLAGDAKQIEQAIARLASAGATDFQAVPLPYGPEPAATLRRTRELLGELARA